MPKNRKNDKLSNKIFAVKISLCWALLVFAVWLLIIVFEAVWGQDYLMSLIRYVLAASLPIFVILSVIFQALLYVKYKFKSDKSIIAFVFSAIFFGASIFIFISNRAPHSLYDGPVRMPCGSHQSGGTIIVCDQNGIY